MKYSDLFRTAAAAALSIALAAVPAMAKNGNPKVKVAKPTSAGPKAKAPKTQTTNAPKSQTAKAKTQTTRTASSAATTKSSTRSASKKGSSTTLNRSDDGTPATSLEDFADNTPRPTTPNQPLSKAQQKLLSNPELAQRMRLKLGSDPMVAASGFKSFGQFNATVNNANNLGLNFWLLKSLMVNQGMSLGQAKKAARAMDGRAVSLATPVDPTTTRPTSNPRPTTTTRPTSDPRPTTTTRPADNPRPTTTTRPTRNPRPTTTTKPATSTTARTVRGES